MNRRGFILGSTAILTAPSIVRASSLMPVSTVQLVTVDLGPGMRYPAYGLSPAMDALEAVREANRFYAEMLERLNHFISAHETAREWRFNSAIKASPYWRT
jgi:hypothetical protein